MKLFSINILVLIVLSLVSCREIVYLDQDIKREAYVYSFISDTSQVIEVLVGEVESAIGKSYWDDNEPTIIENATVRVESNGVSVILRYDNFTERYMGSLESMQPEQGKIYYLSIMTDDFGELTANTTIPVINESLELNYKIKSVKSYDYGGGATDRDITVAFWWNSISPSNPYYYFNLEEDVISDSSYQYDEYDYSFISFYPEVQYASSKTDIVNAHDVEIYYYGDSSNIDFTVQLNVFDYSGYMFYKKFDDAGYQIEFFSEPIIVQGNIENGLGVFMGYVNVEQKITVNLDE